MPKRDRKREAEKKLRALAQNARPGGFKAGVPRHQGNPTRSHTPTPSDIAIAFQSLEQSKHPDRVGPHPDPGAMQRFWKGEPHTHTWSCYFYTTYGFSQCPLGENHAKP